MYAHSHTPLTLSRSLPPSFSHTHIHSHTHTHTHAHAYSAKHTQTITYRRANTRELQQGLEIFYHVSATATKAGRCRTGLALHGRFIQIPKSHFATVFVIQIEYSADV